VFVVLKSYELNKLNKHYKHNKHNKHNKHFVIRFAIELTYLPGGVKIKGPAGLFGNSTTY